MRRAAWIALFIVASVLPASVPPSVHAQQSCQFVLGFAALHDLIPLQVGQCLADETHNAETGDAVQQTTGGLLVWRKSDNWTAFTDGYQSWVNGPLGLQQRLNDQRFSWEQDPDMLAIVPQPTPGERCHTAGLTMSSSGANAGAGHAGVYISFTNDMAVSCTFYGYAGAQMLDAGGNPMQTQVVRGGGYLFRDPGPATVAVLPGGSATFGLEWGQVPVGDETGCPESRWLQVIPPDEYVPLTIPLYIHACNAGTLRITAVGPPQ